MLRELAKSIREFKRPSILAPVLVSCEVMLECIIPFIVARLVNQIKGGCSIDVILWHGLVLVVMAGLSLTFGWLAGTACSRRRAGSPATCGGICSARYRPIRLKTSTSSPLPLS